MDKNIGQYLKELREKKHLSQNQLAEKLHISRSVIAKYETGEREPSFNNLIIISKYFKIPITNLIPIYEKSIESPNTKDILNYLLRQNKIFRNIVFALIIIILMITVSSLIYINIMNYVSTKVYRVASIDDNPIIKDGLLIKTKNKVYISLVSNLDFEKVERVKFYFLDNNEKVYIFETSNFDYIRFYADLKNNEYISFKNYDKFFNNSFIEIHYKDSTTKYVKINYEFDYTNNNLENNFEEIGENVSPELKESDIEKSVFYEMQQSELYDIVKPFMEEYNYETFNIKLDGINYEVSVINNVFSILYKDKGKKYNLSYMSNKETLKLDEVKTPSKTLYSINLNINECEGKMCSNVDKDIKLIKEIINEIKK